MLVPVLVKVPVPVLSMLSPPVIVPAKVLVPLLDPMVSVAPVLVTTPGSAIQLGNSSILKINNLAFAKAGSSVPQRTADLQLTSGVVSALIDPSTPKITDFQVQTPEGSAAARGTFYAVMVYQGKTYVSVAHGRVGAIANSKHDL